MKNHENPKIVRKAKELEDNLQKNIQSIFSLIDKDSNDIVSKQEFSWLSHHRHFDL